MSTKTGEAYENRSDDGGRKRLYEAATRIRELEPWELLWDMDIIGIRVGDEPEDTVFYSILGKGGDCYGVAVYEGYEAFNSFLMLMMQEQMNLSVEYAMYNQMNLTCYWGSREEMTAKQREIIKELGYKYRGKNNWLYFLSYEPGYYPYNLNRDEQYKIMGLGTYSLSDEECYNSVMRCLKQTGG